MSSYSGSGAPVTGTVGGGQVSRVQRFQATIGNSVAAVTVNLPVAELDALYQVSVTPVSSTGAPPAGSNRVLTITKTPTQVTITAEVAQGVASTYTFDVVTYR